MFGAKPLALVAAAAFAASAPAPQTNVRPGDRPGLLSPGANLPNVILEDDERPMRRVTEGQVRARRRVAPPRRNVYELPHPRRSPDSHMKASPASASAIPSHQPPPPPDPEEALALRESGLSADMVSRLMGTAMRTTFVHTPRPIVQPPPRPGGGGSCGGR